MIIGIDAGALSVTDERLKVGVYRVIVNFLRNLSVIDTTNNYRLYSFDPIDSELMKILGDRFENRVLWPVKAWSTVRLPLELSLHPVDVFLGVSQMIPKHIGKSAGFIYDLGFLHRPESYPGSAEKLRKQTAVLLKRSDKIVTISETVKADILSHFTFKRSDIIVAYPGADSRFTLKGPVFKHTAPYFLFVGAMKPGKNIPAIIRAFAEFRKITRAPYDLLLIGGDYWKDNEIDDTVRKLSLQKNVRLVGHVSDDSLPQYFRGSVSFVSPSHYEGFCLPAVEAMACGCPVIGSTKGAMREIVNDAGILVDPADIHALAGAMKEMAYNAEQRVKYAKNGISNAKKYTWSTFAKTVFSVVESFGSH